MFNGKWLLIIGLIAASGLAALRNWHDPKMGRPIRLGLDLQGGIHLVVGVQTDDALKAELDDVVKSLRSSLDSKEIAYQSVERDFDPAHGTYRVVLKGIAAEASDRARKVIERAARGFTVEVTTAQITATLPAGRISDIRSATVEQAFSTIQERVNITGVAEPVIQRQGADQILIQLPGVQDSGHVKDLIGRVAALEIKLVSSGPFPSQADALKGHAGGLPSSLEVLEFENDEGTLQYYVVESVAIVGGRDLRSAKIQRDSETNQPAVGFNLNAEGATRFGEMTGKNVGKYLAVVLDNKIKNVAVIRSRISESGQISGGFTQDEAKELSLVLKAGALPAKIQYLEERTVGPSLGAESVKKGAISGLVGLAAIIVLMVVYYRVSGINAVVALILNAIYLFGALALIRATLTLPGIAGAILTLGMAVDANVLIFESIRENLRAGVAPGRSIEDGFAKAFGTIVDTHLTTILAALALWMLGSGPVRGFGVTLLIGLLISIFTAYFVSKTIFETFVLRRQWKAGETLSI